jgi:hypothetical protein
MLGVVTGGLVAGIVRTHHALNPGRGLAGAGKINDHAVGAHPNCDCDSLSTGNAIGMGKRGGRDALSLDVHHTRHRTLELSAIRLRYRRISI